MAELISATLNKPARTHLMAILFVLAMICLIALIINLAVGVEQLPRGLRGRTPWFVGGLALFGAAGVAVLLTSRIPLRVREREDGVRVIEVGRRLTIEEPDELRYGYLRFKAHRMPASCILLLGVYKDGECRLALRNEWGGFHDAPAGWPAEFPQLAPCPTYDVMSGRPLVALVREFERRG